MIKNKTRPLFGPLLISTSLLFSPLAFSIPSFLLPGLTSSAKSQQKTLKKPIKIKDLYSENKIDGEYIVVFHSDVSNTTIDKIGHRINSQSSLISGIDSWALDRLDQASLPLDTVFNPIGTGAGVYPYIIDTGIIR